MVNIRSIKQNEKKKSNTNIHCDDDNIGTRAHAHAHNKKINRASVAWSVVAYKDNNMYMCCAYIQNNACYVAACTVPICIVYILCSLKCNFNSIYRTCIINIID